MLSYLVVMAETDSLVVTAEITEDFSVEMAEIMVETVVIGVVMVAEMVATVVEIESNHYLYQYVNKQFQEYNFL